MDYGSDLNPIIIKKKKNSKHIQCLLFVGYSTIVFPEETIFPELKGQSDCLSQGHVC